VGEVRKAMSGRFGVEVGTSDYSSSPPNIQDTNLLDSQGERREEPKRFGVPVGQSAPQKDGIGGIIQERRERASQALTDVSTGKITAAEGAMRFGGATVGVAAEIPAHTIAEGARALNDFTNGGLEEAAMHFLENNPMGIAAVKAMQFGAKHYNKWAKQNPRAAKNVQGVADIGAVALPLGAKLQQGSKSIVNRKIINPLSEKNRIRRAITPPGFKGGANSDVTIFGTNVPRIDKHQQELIDTFKTVPMARARYQAQLNVNAMQMEIEAASNVLRAELKELNIPFDKFGLKRRMRSAVANAKFNRKLRSFRGVDKKLVDEEISKFFDGIEGKNVDDLLAARQAYDFEARINNPSFYTDGVKNATGEVVDLLRTTANNFLESTVKASGKATRSPIAQMHRLRKIYELEDIFIQRADVASRFALGRGAQHIGEMVPSNLVKAGRAERTLNPAIRQRQ
jgi:hypothetical protein